MPPHKLPLYRFFIFIMKRITSDGTALEISAFEIESNRGAVKSLGRKRIIIMLKRVVTVSKYISIHAIYHLPCY